jgi:hypothetical protein
MSYFQEMNENGLDYIHHCEFTGGIRSRETAKRCVFNRETRYCAGWLSVERYPEGQNIQLLKARSHAEHHLPMVCVIQVAPSRGMAHASGVPSDDVMRCHSVDASLGMPLHLSWPSVMHGRRKNGHHGRRRI